MKKTVVALAFAVAMGALAQSVTAQDMTGTWVLAVELDAGSGEATFELTQEAGKRFA